MRGIAQCGSSAFFRTMEKILFVILGIFEVFVIPLVFIALICALVRILFKKREYISTILATLYLLASVVYPFVEYIFNWGYFREHLDLSSIEPCFEIFKMGWCVETILTFSISILLAIISVVVFVKSRYAKFAVCVASLIFVGMLACFYVGFLFNLNGFAIIWVFIVSSVMAVYFVPLAFACYLFFARE